MTWSKITASDGSAWFGRFTCRAFDSWFYEVRPVGSTKPADEVEYCGGVYSSRGSYHPADLAESAARATRKHLADENRRECWRMVRRGLLDAAVVRELVGPEH